MILPKKDLIVETKVQTSSKLSRDTKQAQHKLSVANFLSRVCSCDKQCYTSQNSHIIIVWRYTRSTGNKICGSRFYVVWGKQSKKQIIYTKKKWQKQTLSSLACVQLVIFSPLFRENNCGLHAVDHFLVLLL